jgi:hypothetical protein
VISGTVAPDTGALNLRSDREGLRVGAAGSHGVMVDEAGENGLYVRQADEDGLRIGNAGSEGARTISTTNNGVEINRAEDNGIFIGAAGDPGFFGNDSVFADAIEISRAAGDGVFVGRVGRDGVRVHEAGLDGFQVDQAEDNGIEVNAYAGMDLAAYFGGDVQVIGTCSGCLVATFGVNTGGVALEAGDIVTVRGIRNDASLAAAAPALLQVARAQPGESVIGVVAGRAERDVEDEAGGGPPPHLPRAGPAPPGAYVTIVTHGVMQVRVGAANAAIRSGARLTVGSAGAARPTRAVTVDGVQLAEAAPGIGIALASPHATASGDRVWALVNPR